MSEVDRFFRQLVSALAASGSDRLRQPVTVGEISGTILPYRAYRRERYKPMAQYGFRGAT